jgi:hypothetical protein
MRDHGSHTELLTTRRGHFGSFDLRPRRVEDNLIRFSD